jgi:glycosyltransferase involved in cell wall biosynthesis
MKAHEVHDGADVYRFTFHEALREGQRERWTGILREVVRLEKEFKPDVVHINIPSATAMFHLLSAKSWRAPIVSVIHGAFPESAGRIDTLMGQVLANSAWVTANSEATLQSALAIAPGFSSRSSVIYNGLEKPSIGDSVFPADSQIIVCIARLVKNKGIEVALQAFEIVRQRLPNARMIIAGDGPEYDNLKALAEEMGLSEAVNFRGWVEPSGIAALIDEGSQVWVPSLEAESFGNVAVEAMQMGRPVIVTDQGALPEVVESEKTGIVIPARDAHALSNASLRLFADAAFSQKLGDAGRERAATLFGIDRHADEYDALYRRIAAARTE